MPNCPPGPLVFNSLHEGMSAHLRLYWVETAPRDGHDDIGTSDLITSHSVTAGVRMIGSRSSNKRPGGWFECRNAGRPAGFSDVARGVEVESLGVLKRCDVDSKTTDSAIDLDSEVAPPGRGDATPAGVPGGGISSASAPDSEKKPRRRGPGLPRLACSAFRAVMAPAFAEAMATSIGGATGRGRSRLFLASSAAACADEKPFVLEIC